MVYRQEVIPVRFEENSILTFILNYEKELLRLTGSNDIRIDCKCKQKASWYYKLRISKKQIDSILQRNRLRIMDTTDNNVFVYALTCKEG